MRNLADRRIALAMRALLLAGVASVAVPALAQTTAPDPSAQPAESTTAAPGEAQQVIGSEQSDSSNDIVVTGTRRSLEDALETKRESSQVIDSLSSEGIGKLPDLDLAESLQRLPGVQINRSAARRLGTVSIRGLPGDFSQTLLNGEYLASPDVSNFSFGTVRSEVFSGIDVIKSESATDLTGGLSGLVNLRTGSPLSAGNHLALTVDTRYEGLPKSWSPGGALVLSHEFIPGVLAVRAAVGYQNLNFREDNVQVNTYDRIAGAATDDPSDDVYAPQEVRMATNVTKGNSYTGSLAVAWRPTTHLTASLSGFYNDYRPNAYSSQFRIDSRATSVRTGIDPADDEGDFGSTLYHLNIANPEIFVDSRRSFDRYRTDALTGNLEWSDDRWNIQGTAHYTDARLDDVATGYETDLKAATAAGATNGYTAEINTGAGDLGSFVYDLSPSMGQIVDLDQPFGAPIGPTYREVDSLTNPLESFLGGYRNNVQTDRELAFHVDVERQLDFGPIKSIKVGGLYRDKAQGHDQSLASLYGADLSGLSNSLYNYSFLNGTGEFMGGNLGYFDRADYGELDVQTISDMLTPVSASNLPNGAFIGPEGLVNFVDSTALSNTYRSKQKIYGGYALTNLDYDVSSYIHVRGNAGVHYEHTDRATRPGDGSQVLPFSYANWLPSANLIVELGGKLVARASYNKTMRRPQVQSFAVQRSIAVDGTGRLITVNLGASDLKPFISDNLDLSLEWYNRKGSVLSALFFNKRVSDYAGTTRICPADGGGFGFGPLTEASGVCRTVNATPASGSYPAVFADSVANINVTANQDTFTLKGVELTAQQNLDFLPAPFNGLGGQVNYTYVDFSSASSFRLSEISRDTVNAILYYETAKFGIRAAYNYRSNYFLGSGGTASGADRMVEARSQLDLTGQYNVSDKLQLNLEMFNVTNAPLIEYEGDESRVRNYTLYGRTVTAGFQYRF